MKQLLLGASIVCAFVACNSATTSTETANDTTATTMAASDAPVAYAYTPGYSANFEIGDSKNAQIVLELWKDFDNNTLDNHKDAFADSVTIELADGSVVKGLKDSVLSSMKSYRSGFTTVVSSVDVVIPLKPKDKEESWVCVWGKEIDTDKKNKTDSAYLNENWMFNKDGKIAYMSQFRATPAKAK